VCGASVGVREFQRFFLKKFKTLDVKTRPFSCLTPKRHRFIYIKKNIFFIIKAVSGYNC
jgi:hypothetical protein